MHPFRAILACRGLLTLGAGCLFFFHPALAAPDDDRVTALNEQIHTLETVVASTKDASGKARLEEQLQRLQQELKILRDRQALDAREHVLQANRATNTLDQLREKLRGIDVAVDEEEAHLRELGTARRRAAHERDTLANELAGLRVQPDASADRLAQLEEQVTTKGEELRALALEREAVEANVDLAHDADRQRERIKAADTTADRPTARAWFESFTRVRAEQKTGGQITAAAQDLAQKRQVSEAAVDLSRQKLAKFDEELALLEKQTGFFRRDARVERLLAQERNQKAELSARLPFLGRQVDAIKQTQAATAAREDLAKLTATFEEENLARLQAGYLRRLRWPALSLAGLLVLQFLATYALLPIFFRNESLFLARRFARYATILFATGVLAGFLFDDLSMIAATLGIVSAALVISLQDVCTSIAGWCAIMFSGKFGIGDRLEIDGTRGDVLDVQLLRTTLLEINGWLGIDQPTGRVIVLPNNFIFKNKVFNFSHGHPFIWGKIDVTVTFATPVASALTLFQRLLEEETREQFEAARQAALTMQRRYGVEDAVYTPKIYTHIADSGVTLSLFYVAHYREYSVVRNRINRRLIAEIESHPHIQLAYQTLSVLRTEAATNQPSAMLGADATTPPFFRGETPVTRGSD